MQQRQIKLEKYIGKVTESTGGFIDIQISNNKFIICIENKIDAIDQPNQLKRYKSYLNKINNYKILIYLTKFGDESIETELIAGIDYFCLSYDKDILNWMDQCIEICTENDFILKGSLIQYSHIIKEITGQVQSNRMQKEIHSKILENIKASKIVVSEFDNAIKYLCNKIRTDVVINLNNKLTNAIIEEVDTGSNFSSIFIKIPNKEYMIGIESFSGKGHENGALFIGKIDLKNHGNVDYKYSICIKIQFE